MLPEIDRVGLSGGESDGSRNFRRITPGIGRGVTRGDVIVVTAVDRAVLAVCNEMV